MADEALATLRLAGPQDQAYYGSGKHQTLKHMRALQEDLRDTANATSDLARYDLVSLRAKRLSAAAEMLKVKPDKGTTHPEFASALDGQLHFLSLEPTAEHDFPS